MSSFTSIFYRPIENGSLEEPFLKRRLRKDRNISWKFELLSLLTLQKRRQRQQQRLETLEHWLALGSCLQLTSALVAY